MLTLASCPRADTSCQVETFQINLCSVLTSSLFLVPPPFSYLIFHICILYSSVPMYESAPLAVGVVHSHIQD